MTFFVFLPGMLIRQCFLIGENFLATLFTWNRVIVFSEIPLRVLYLNNVLSFLATAIFGERFLCIHFSNVMIDPGPPFGTSQLKKYLRNADTVQAVLVTHRHEEHIGNAPFVADQLQVPIYGSPQTLEEIKNPQKLSFMRRYVIGQPLPPSFLSLREVSDELEIPPTKLLCLSSPGHSEDHVSFYDPIHKILFAGDSFLHEIFTSPNRDVNSSQWLDTLRKYTSLDIQTMIGSHGYVTTIDPRIPSIPFVTEKKRPISDDSKQDTVY